MLLSRFYGWAMAFLIDPLRSALFLARAARRWRLFGVTPLRAARWVLFDGGVRLSLIYQDNGSATGE
jgi:hypothetical protein